MDYQDDCLSIGLKELHGSNVVDVNKRNHIYTSYSEVDAKNSYGKGMTVTRVLPDLVVDRTDILSKIKNKYFDLVVYGSIWRCNDYLNDVLENYNVNRIAVIDGEDHHHIHQSVNYDVKYFKRELYSEDTRLNPISFALPTSKFRPTFNKTKEYAFITPLDINTYIYDSEEDYYKDYKEAMFGVTCKKAGWDSMRHYEIMGNGCIPIFLDIDNCPNRILTFFPKSNCVEVKKLLDSGENPTKVFEENYPYFLTHMQENNTTSALAKRFIDLFL